MAGVSGPTVRNDTSEDLLRRCNAAIRDADFPTVWSTVLRGHRLVVGSPVQHAAAESLQLHIRLVTGQQIVYDSSSRQFTMA